MSPQATDERNVDHWRAGCECARAGLCYRCRAAAEIERLYKALAKANAHHEHFERESYLRADEIERLEFIQRDFHNVDDVAEIARLRAAIRGYVNATKADSGFRAVRWWELQEIAAAHPDVGGGK